MMVNHGSHYSLLQFFKLFVKRLLGRYAFRLVGALRDQKAMQ
jgi:hypothetical protein